MGRTDEQKKRRNEQRKQQREQETEDQGAERRRKRTQRFEVQRQLESEGQATRRQQKQKEATARHREVLVSSLTRGPEMVVFRVRGCAHACGCPRTRHNPCSTT